MFSKFVYVATGFLQNSGTRTRLIQLWSDLYTEYGGNGHLIKLLPWSADWKAEAELYNRTSTPDAKIVMLAYSWGAGKGFVEFGNALHKRGRKLDVACLIDPVYRHKYWLGNWRAFVPGIPILIPESVGVVHHWYQQQSWPRGHKLIASSQDTKIDSRDVVKADHGHMDDHPLVIAETSTIIRDFLDSSHPSKSRASN